MVQLPQVDGVVGSSSEVVLCRFATGVGWNPQLMSRQPLRCFFPSSPCPLPWAWAGTVAGIPDGEAAGAGDAGLVEEVLAVWEGPASGCCGPLSPEDQAALSSAAATKAVTPAVTVVSILCRRR